MIRMRSSLLGLLVAVGCAPHAAKTTTPVAQKEGPPASAVATWAKGAWLMPDLGVVHRAVTTTNKDAQTYFDQGLRLVYAFNHDEATRSFAKAAELDPQCASCFWGVALTVGPNYNVPMLADRAGVAWEALQKARALAGKATPVEQALIEALTKRYKGPDPLPPPAMQPFNEAYAAAMREVAHKFPADLDVQTLFAEAMMDVQPWHMWTTDGKPGALTNEILVTLDAVLAKDPQHPGANHYYIHTIEASPHPEKGLPMAERLPLLTPGAGHIMHMPAHIFQRVGRYNDAAATNRKAIAVDAAYMSKTTPPGYYSMYLAHNDGFLAFADCMLGLSAEALTAARAAAKSVPPEMVAMMPGMDFFVSEHLLTMVRFSRWDELLAEPRPPEKYRIMTAFWLHGHGMALAAKGRFDDANKELAELVALHEKIPADMRAGNSPARDVAAVAEKILEARIADAQKKPNALALWADAVKLEDGLNYSEPADWLYPVRHFQGAALLAAGNAKEAEAIYREDLRRNPANGWSLFGLAQSLKAQQKKKDAAAAMKEFEKAWQWSDVKLTSSVL